MAKRNRLVISALVLTVMLVMLFSAFYIAAEAGHDCAGEDCPICYQITVCENVLRFCGQAFLLSVLSANAGVFAAPLSSFAKKTAYRVSPVTLKVKLSN